MPLRKSSLKLILDYLTVERSNIRSLRQKIGFLKHEISQDNELISNQTIRTAGELGCTTSMLKERMVNIEKKIHKFTINSSTKVKEPSLGKLLRSYYVLLCCSPFTVKLYMSPVAKMLMNTFLWNLFIHRFIKKTFFDHFCAGENSQEAIITGASLLQKGIYSIIDYAAETEQNELKSFESFSDENFNNLYQSIAIAAQIQGAVAMKISSLLKTSILSENYSLSKLLLLDGTKKILSVVERAYENRVELYVDAEKYSLQTNIDKITLYLMEKYPGTVFNTYQMYRKDSFQRLQDDYQKISQLGVSFCAKLVRGAYMNQENRLYKKSSPIYSEAHQTHSNYNNAVEFLLEKIKTDRISKCIIASHNLESIEKAASLVKTWDLANNVYFGQLLGMKDYLTLNLSVSGFKAYKYVPYGPVKEVLPYLGRRALENASIFNCGNQDRKYLKEEIKKRLKSLINFS